jgi:hypothetical protein
MCSEIIGSRGLRVFPGDRIEREPRAILASKRFPASMRERSLPVGDRRRLTHRAIRGVLGFLARSLHGLLANFLCLRAPLALISNFFQFVVGEMFDPDK